MISLLSLSRRGISEEIANRIMVRHGSTQLLRALCGEPDEEEEEWQPPRLTHRPATTRYVPVAERPCYGAPLAVREIIAAAEEAYGLEHGTVTGRDKHRPVVMARATAIRLIRDRVWDTGEPRHSTTTIGRYVGRDHSTVCHALDHFAAYCKAWPEVGEIYDRLRDAA